MRLTIAIYVALASFLFLPFATNARTSSQPADEDPPPTSYLGFDRNIYPGDDAIPILRKTFAYSGYWISPPPGEKINTWAGKRQLLQSQGFGFMVLFRGRESRELKTPAQAAQK